MKLLMIGGTLFLGKHIAEAALERGHELTLFNRGQTNPDLFPEAEHLRGDRDGGLGALEGRQWDAVIDTCGYVPRIVRQSAELLSPNVGLYVYVSSISVFSDSATANQDENGTLARLDDEGVEEVNGETYGGLKVLCEQTVEESCPGRAFIPRPGLIVGPDDSTGRFTYWVTRVAQGGEILAPDNPGNQVQVIDVRDLSRWIVRMVEDGRTGIYNATGPDRTLTMGAFLDACKDVTASDATFTWVSEEYLLEHNVQPFSELPLWVPRSEAGIEQIDVGKAVGAGLTFRPLEETIKDTLDWARQSDRASGRKELESLAGRSGLTPERERELLDGWRSS